MAMPNNGFDNSFEKAFRVPQGATTDAKVDAALKAIAANPAIREALRRAIYDHEQVAGQRGWCGPTLSQVVRGAVSEVLNAEPGYLDGPEPGEVIG